MRHFHVVRFIALPLFLLLAGPVVQAAELTVDGKFRRYEDAKIRVEFDEEQGGTVTGLWLLAFDPSWNWGEGKHVITLRGSQIEGAPDGSDKGFTQYWEHAPEVTAVEEAGETTVTYHGRMRHKEGVSSGIEYTIENVFVHDLGMFVQHTTLAVHTDEMAVINPQLKLWSLTKSLDLSDQFEHLAVNAHSVHEGAGDKWTLHDVSGNVVTDWVIASAPGLPNHGYKLLPDQMRPPLHWFDIYAPAAGGVGRVVVDLLGCNSYNYWSNFEWLHTRTSELAWWWGDWDRHAIEGTEVPVLEDGMTIQQTEEFWLHAGGWTQFVEAASQHHGINLLCGNQEACPYAVILDNCDKPPPADGDGDGYDEMVDCNDADVSIHPGAEETCGDGIDQDCSGADLECSEPPFPDARSEEDTSVAYPDLVAGQDEASPPPSDDLAVFPEETSRFVADEKPRAAEDLPEGEAVSSPPGILVVESAGAGAAPQAGGGCNLAPAADTTGAEILYLLLAAALALAGIRRRKSFSGATR